MRTGLIIAATALALLGTATTAEARFRGGRSFHTLRPVPAGTGLAGPTARGIGIALPAGSTRAAATGADDRPVIRRPIRPVLAPGPVPIRTATRCADTRLVGSGAGFCAIN